MTSVIIQFYAIVSRREGGCTTFAWKCHVSTRVVLMLGSSIRRKLSLGVGTEEVLVLDGYDQQREQQKLKKTPDLIRCQSRRW